MASEKAAAEFQLEKEIKRIQEAQVCILCFWLLIQYFGPHKLKLLSFEQAEAERSRVSRRASSSWEEDSEIKPLEYAFSLFIVAYLLFSVRYFYEGNYGRL